MSRITKKSYYVAQWGYEIFGIGDSEKNALDDARKNGLSFNDEDVKHSGRNNHGKLVTLEGDELSQGMIVVMSEDDKKLYWDSAL